MRRRDALILGGLFSSAVATPPILRNWPRPFEFAPLPGFDGFRSLPSGTVSGGVDVFAGIGDQSAPVAVPDDPCTALFGRSVWTDDTVPVAVFSDFNCPYCAILERLLIRLRDNGTPVTLIWHEYPLLGPSSERSARAALAAGMQDAADAAHLYLMQKNLRPGPGALHEMAEALGLAGDELIQDVRSARLSRRLARSIALARRLGLPGTPGMMVGRTRVIGAISEKDLRRLIAIEHEALASLCS